MEQPRGWQLPDPVGVLVVLPCLAAWSVLAVNSQLNSFATLCLAPRPFLAGKLVDVMLLSLAELLPDALLATALLMTAAMALPLAWRPTNHVRTRCFPHDRAKLVALFVVLFSTTWAILLAPMSAAGIVAQAGLTTVIPAPLLGFAAAAAIAAHRATREARVALAMCHRVDPIRPFAPGCTIDTARFALRSALACARSCWPAMLLPWLTSRPLLTMAVVTILAFVERSAFRADPRKSVVVILILAISELSVLT